MARRKKYGLSFSWRRATGYSAAKGKLSRKLGIPLTRSGRQRKVGKALGCMLPVLALVLLALLFSVVAHAQDKATIYIYKAPHARTLGRLTFPVYINEVKVAGLDGGRYFVVRLEPGTHAFRSKSKKQGGVELEVKAGETYYLRMETEEDFTVNKPRLTLVPKEQGVYDIKQMKPINQKDIKDSALVDMDFTEQAVKGKAGIGN